MDYKHLFQTSIIYMYRQISVFVILFLKVIACLFEKPDQLKWIGIVKCMIVSLL